MIELSNKQILQQYRLLMHDYAITEHYFSSKNLSSQVFKLHTKSSISNTPNTIAHNISPKFPIKSQKTMEITVKNNENIAKHMEVIKKLTQDAQQLTSIDEIKKYLDNSGICDIKKLANNTVISQGPHNAKIVLIGEAPGEQEDINGVPFCGRSGKLLDNILQSVNLSRNTNLFITNSVFWRPPANRKPTEAEIASCRPFLLQILNIIKPSLLILCGGTALESIFNTKEAKVAQFLGKIITKNDILNTTVDITGIYHPSYLLRSPSNKKVAWVNLQKISEFLDKLLD